MNISVCKLDCLKWNIVREMIKKYHSDFMVFTIDFSQHKEQIDYLLFFVKIAKVAKEFLVVLDIDFDKCLLKNVIIFDNKKYKILLPEYAVGGFIFRFFDSKIAFAIGDNIYKKSYRNYLSNQKIKNILHIDLFDDNSYFEQNLYDKNINIISSKNNGIYSLKK